MVVAAKKILNHRTKKISKILANIFVLVFGVVYTAENILMMNQSAINAFLGIRTSYIVYADENGQEVDAGFFQSEFTSVKDVKANAQRFTQEIVREGSVLLKNDGALPLSSDKRTVSLYSVSCADYVASGTGSSGTNNDKPVTMKDAFEAKGFQVNEGLWDWYQSALKNKKYGRTGKSLEGGGSVFSIGEAPWSALPEVKVNPADAAIFVLSRNGGEGGDVYINNGDPSDMTGGNYLTLSPQEIDVLKNLKQLKDAGTVGSIIVLMNFANQVECDFMDDPEYGIDAALWIGDVGSNGMYAVADILAGNSNPSGRLPDTFWRKHCYNPVMANFGDYTYDDAATIKGSLAMRDFGDHYVVYQEGIYLGYKYTETRYEDAVIGRPDTGEFDYTKVVSYPFGYGLSYTQFEYSDIRIAPSQDGTSYTVSVRVANTGDTAGKEVVQVYLQKPYTEYDVENHIEKAAVELAAFGKTGMLQPGASETVTMTVEKSQFASYDAFGKGTFILDAGDYYLTVARDAHDAVNNILAAKGYGQNEKMTANGNAAAAQKFTLAFDAETFAVASTGAAIVNRFDNADMNRYSGAGSNHVAYISRNNWNGTVKLGMDENSVSLGNHVILTATSQMAEDIKKPVPEKDDVAYPTYGSTKTAYSLIDMRADANGNPIPYDDPKWDELLDQLSWQETLDLLSHGLRMTYAVSSINKFQTIDHNGATGPVQKYGANESNNRGLAVTMNDPDKGEFPTLYPCNALVAATYNTKLVEEFGTAMGDDCLWAGYNGLYGFGINLHRSPYGGRNYEYYGEDGVLTGLIAAAEAKGIQSKGIYVYMKHCLLNDQETYREGICTWANEQSIRELYLKPFQYAIEEAGAYNVMSSFNRIGVKWSGHQGFLQHVIKDEFGLRGFAVTDFYLGMMGGSVTYMSLPEGLMNGSDLPDGDSPDELPAYETGYGRLAWNMRDAAHRILYTVSQSNAMNGITANMYEKTVTPAWVTLARTLVLAFGILAGLNLVLFAACFVFEKLDQRKNKPTKAQIIS